MSSSIQHALLEVLVREMTSSRGEGEAVCTLPLVVVINESLKTEAEGRKEVV